MSEYLLYHMPGSCSRVALNALEEIGAPYRETSVALGRGEQYSPDYLAINPKGKVPVLVASGTAITELPVILYYLAQMHPAAKLLPADKNGNPSLAALSDLVWLAGTMHPAASRMFRPEMISSADAAHVKAAAMKLLAGHAERMSQRLTGSEWWYGAEWSIVDVFIAWVFDLAAQFSFPLENYPALFKHRIQAEARESFVRVRALERAIVTRDQLPTPPDLHL